jgi:thioredoxin reductase (NADPH)
MQKTPSILELQAFPVLTASQIAQLHSFGSVKTTFEGDVLFDLEDSSYCLVVVLEGQTAVIDRGNKDRVLKTSGAGEFNGELGLLTGQRTFTACIVRERGKALIIPPDRVHYIVENIPELSVLLVTAFAARRQLLMQSSLGSLTIVGSDQNPKVSRLIEFSDRNRIPFRWLNPDNPADGPALAACGFPRTPSFGIVLGGERVIEEATPLDLAKAIGLDLDIKPAAVSDLVVVGAGPAGLAAAVFGASEGLSTLVIEDTAIGGQAGTSSCIENYVGFPAGISGGDLAFRAEVQATKFGARMTLPRRACALEVRDRKYAVHLEDGSVFLARSIVIATGARYRKLNLAGQEAFEGKGIYYAATEFEGRRCRDGTAVVVGGGNSAGQAAMFLSGHARCVHILCRGPDLAASMSEYLLTRLKRTSNVTIQLRSEIAKVQGDGFLQRITIANRATGESRDINVCGLFVMIGADPCTGWLHGTVQLDEKGFVRTAFETPSSRSKDHAGATRSLPSFRTDLPGVFAVGDVRSGSVKRVASAVGEGSVVIQAVHQYLATVAPPDVPAT